MLSLYCDERECDFHQNGSCTADHIEISMRECVTYTEDKLDLKRFHAAEIKKLLTWNNIMSGSLNP